MTSIKVGDLVSWDSAAGTIGGTIESIDLDLNAEGKYIPWLMISAFEPSTGKYRKHRLCGTHNYLKMMKFSVYRGEVMVGVYAVIPMDLWEDI